MIFLIGDAGAYDSIEKQGGKEFQNAEAKRKSAALNILDTRMKAVKLKKDVQTKPRNDAFEAIHSAASGLHKAGMLDQATMRNFDKSCLFEEPKYEGKDV